MKRKHIITAGLVLAVAASSQIGAQERATVFEEVIVTAQKREQSIYDVPVAITAFTAEDMERRGIGNLRDIGKFVPNLNVTNFSAGHPNSVNPFIRGIGLQDHLITTDPGVSVYIDGVYLGRQIGQNWSLSNIERVEVLRGPQGTLYGRNSIGGAINLITRKPGDTNGITGGFELGSRDRINADLYGSYRVNDTLAISASGALNRRGGVGEFINLDTNTEVGEMEDISGRLVVHWTPTSELSVLLTVDAADSNGGLNPYTTFIDEAGAIDPNRGPFADGLRNTDVAPNRFDNATGEAELADVFNSSEGYALTVEYALSENLSTKLVASHRDSRYEAGLDDDSTIVNWAAFPETGFADQDSVELQLNGTFDRLDFVAGAFYFDEEGANRQPKATFDQNPSQEILAQQSDSWAVYANLGYQITDRFHLGAGVRYGEDDKDASVDVGLQNLPDFLGGPGPATVFASESFDEVTWDVKATFKLTDDVSVYGTVATGYQSGQFNPRPFCLFGEFIGSFFATGVSGLPAENCFDQSLENITATNFEAGIRGTFFNRFRASLTGFHTEYEDLPLAVNTTSPVGFNTINAIVDQESDGIEFEGSLNVADGFFINATVGYLDADIDQTPEAQGLAPVLTPEWTVSAGPEYSFPMWGGNISLRVDYSYRAAMNGAPTADPATLQRIASRDLVNFDISYESADRDWTVGLYGRNITDERYENGRLNTGDYILAILSNDASEFGLRARRSFDFN